MNIHWLLKSQIVSTLLGVIVGGISAFALNLYSLNKQFANQEKLHRQAQVEQKKKALVAIREELFHNGALNNKVIDIMNHEEGCEDGIKISSGGLNSSVLSGILLRTRFCWLLMTTN